MSDADPVSLLARALTLETREEIAKADQKASLIMSALLAAAAAIISAVSAGGVMRTGYGKLAGALFWTGFAAWIPALVLLGLTVAPRTGRPQSSRVHYFADAARTGSVGELAEALRRTDPLERDLHQFAVLSQLTMRKYRLVRLGMICSAVFVVLTSLGMLLGAHA